MVCTANVCRSPLAERLLHRALNGEPGPERFAVRSAGTRAWAGAPMDPMAAAELVRLGGDPQGLSARDLSTDDCAEAGLILTATAEHRTQVLLECPQALKRTFTLLEFAHLVTSVEAVCRNAGSPPAVVQAASAARGASRLDDYDVLDPHGRSATVHRNVADVVSTAVDATARALAGPASPPASR